MCVHVRVSIIAFCVHDVVFFLQAEDGIRYLVRSRGLGDVYKRQVQGQRRGPRRGPGGKKAVAIVDQRGAAEMHAGLVLSLIHI